MQVWLTESKTEVNIACKKSFMKVGSARRLKSLNKFLIIPRRSLFFSFKILTLFLLERRSQIFNRWPSLRGSSAVSSSEFCLSTILHVWLMWRNEIRDHLILTGEGFPQIIFLFQNRAIFRNLHHYKGFDSRKIKFRKFWTLHFGILQRCSTGLIRDK